MQGEQSYPQTERLAQDESAPWVISYGELGRIREQIESHNGNLDVQGIYVKLIDFMKTGHREVKDASMVCLGLLFRKGLSPQFLKCPNAASALIIYFNILSRELQSMDCIQEEPMEPSKVESRLLGVMSLLSQLIHDSPDWRLPQSKRFVMNLMMLSPELVAGSPLKQEITKVVSVIWLALSREAKYLNSTSLLSRFKQLLLESYRLAEDSRVLMRFTSALKNIIKECPITLQETRKYELIAIMTRLLTKEQVQQVSAAFKLKAIEKTYGKDSTIGTQ